MAATSTGSLRGASAEALAELRERIGTRTLEESTTLGEDLFALAGLFRDEAGLRRMATDPSVPADGKEQVVSSVLSGKVGDKARDVAVDAVRRRWTRGADLPVALESLAVIAATHGAGKRDADRVGDQLFAVSQLVSDNRELYSALGDPARSVADRTALLTGLVKDDVLPATQTLLDQAVAAAGTDRGSFDGVLTGYQRIVASAQGETLAVVRTARELSSSDQERLSAALGKQYSTTVHLHVVVDPSLVGGLRVEIGDDVIDGSVSTRLDDARRLVAG